MAGNSHTIQFYAKLDTSKTRVDHEAGVIRGVSVITGNLTAIGHELDVDDTTLTQIQFEGQRMQKVPVKINHGSGVDAVCGHLINFRREGNKVLADWKLLKSHPQFSQILETAEEQPETVGLSVSFKGPENPVVVDGRNMARCETLLSTDYVIHPAANPTGLFQQKPVDNQGTSKMANDNKEPTLSDVLAAVNALSQKVESQGQFIEGLQNQQAEAEALEIAGLTTEQAEALGISIEDLQAAQDYISENFGDEALSQITQETQAEYAGADTGSEAGDAAGASAGSEAGDAAGANSSPAVAAMSAELNKLGAAVTNLTAKLNRQELKAERDQLDAEFEAIETRFTELEQKEQRLTELEAENENLKKALNGAGRRLITTNFSASGAQVNKDENAFESKVAKKVEEFKALDPKLSDASAKAKAWQFCINEDPDGYNQFRAKGTTTQL